MKVEGSVKNKGWRLENVDYKDTSMPEEIRIRGFKINKIEQLEKKWSEPAKFFVSLMVKVHMEATPPSFLV